ncbi:MAG: hypothetical protein WBE92_17870 [Steroidobacteraceae bacterium]
MASPAVAATPRCADCRHFDNAPESLERAIPGLKVMGSGYGAVRAEDGLCEVHGRYLSADYRCADFDPRSPEKLRYTRAVKAF